MYSQGVPMPVPQRQMPFSPYVARATGFPPGHKTLKNLFGIFSVSVVCDSRSVEVVTVAFWCASFQATWCLSGVVQASLGKGWEKSMATLAWFKWPEAWCSYFRVTLIDIIKVCVFRGPPGHLFIEICESFILS